MSRQVFFCLIALLSSASWALGSTIWRIIGRELSPSAVNLIKCLIGLVLLGGLLLYTGAQPVGRLPVLLLVLSGLIGIAVGDTYFFKSLFLLGPRLTSLLGALTPVFISVSAFLLLGEKLSLPVWGGIAVTVAGIYWVAAERVPEGDGARDRRLGIWYSLLAILCTTAGVLMAKKGMENIPSVQAAFIRMAGGALGMVLWGLFKGELRNWLAQAGGPRLFSKILLVNVIAIFGGFWLGLLALKNLNTGVASTLTSTSVLFVIPLSALLLKEKVTFKAVSGATVAVAGLALLFWFK